MGIFAVFIWLNINFLAAYDSSATDDVIFEVKPGWNLNTIAEELEKREIIANSWSIYFLGKRRTDDQGQPLRILAGEYQVSASLKPREILDILFSGEVVLHDVVIPPGLTIRETAQLFSEKNWVLDEK